MRLFPTFLLIIIISLDAAAQPFQPTSAMEGRKQQHVVRITGVRFSYPLVQHLIDNFSRSYPDIQVIIESRGTSDPSQYDILVEAYEAAEDVRAEREYVYFARYAVLPVANSHSAFARVYGEKGLNKQLVTQLYFHDPYSDKGKQQDVKATYTVYTRLQKAGAPIVFANYFGFDQKDIKGKSIAGSDEHLLKALVRDTTGLSYAPVPVIYDRTTQKPIEGITVLPVDLDGNNKIGDSERIYSSLKPVVERFETSAGDINNVPVAYLHFSLDKKTPNADALIFLRWVIDHSEAELQSFGYLKPEPGKVDKVRFEEFARKQTRQ